MDEESPSKQRRELVIVGILCLVGYGFFMMISKIAGVCAECTWDDDCAGEGSICQARVCICDPSFNPHIYRCDPAAPVCIDIFYIYGLLLLAGSLLTCCMSLV